MKTNQFKSLEEASLYLFNHGWRLRSTSGHYLNDNVPGSTYTVIKITDGCWKVRPGTQLQSTEKRQAEDLLNSKHEFNQ